LLLLNGGGITVARADMAMVVAARSEKSFIVLVVSRTGYLSDSGLKGVSTELRHGGKTC
jgi:hypothetical protein